MSQTLQGPSGTENIDAERERLLRLSEILRNPQTYIQRCVEHVTFSPAGGHRWVRNLQILIPGTPDIASTLGWHILPLGYYARRRFPDFIAETATKERVNLLTRKQHGDALTRVLLLRYLDNLLQTLSADLLKTPAVFSAYTDLQAMLFGLVTSAGVDAAQQKLLLTEGTQKYEAFLSLLPIDPKLGEKELQEFADELAEVIETTRYLCWIEASPGDVLNLVVTYSTKDSRLTLGEGSIKDALKRINQGIVEPRKSRRAVWADWYRQLGISPLNYEFNIPSQRHTGSYYFTVEPPAGSEVTYLDWESGNSRTDTELDCAFDSAHTHYMQAGLSTPPVRGNVVRAYIRIRPHHHKQLLGAALLNGALVYILALGRLPDKLGESALSLLVAVPSVLTAYLVQQQRHYHAHPMRRQRIILWTYLAISTTFLVTISFSGVSGTPSGEHIGVFAELVTWALGASSAAVFVWYWPQGHLFGPLTTWRMEKRRKREEARISEEHKSADNKATDGQLVPSRSKWRGKSHILEGWRCYEWGVHAYCTAVFRSAAVSAVGTFIAIALLWPYPAAHKKTPRADRALQSHSSLKQNEAK